MNLSPKTPPPYDASAIVLAGGKSRRMGQNKCLLPYQGLPLIQHVTNQLIPLFREVLVSTNEPDTYQFLGLPTVADEIADQGPLMGIISSMAKSQHTWNFVVAADIPELPHPLIEELYQNTAHHTCVVPITSSGHYQPLFAFYHCAMMVSMRERIKSRESGVIDAIRVASPCEISICDTMLENLNTPLQYRQSIK